MNSEQVYRAVTKLHPFALTGIHWVWLDDADPQMQKWDEDALGPLDMAALEAAANEPEPKPDLPAWKFHAVLRMASLDATAETVIAALSEPAQTVARMRLERSLTFSRGDALLNQLAASAGVTDAELDTLWDQALAL